MYLLELTDNDKIIRINTVVDMIKDDLDSGKITSNITVDELLKRFRDFEVVLGAQDLYNMIKVKPLNKVVSNIQGKEVVFKGLPQKPAIQEPPPPEQSQEVVAKMAKKAMK